MAELPASSVLLRNVLLGLSAFASSLSVYLGWVNATKAMLKPRAWFFVLAYVGAGGMAGVIAKAVFAAPTVRVSADAWAFAVFELIFFVGIVGIALMHRRTRRRAGRGK